LYIAASVGPKGPPPTGEPFGDLVLRMSIGRVDGPEIKWMHSFHSAVIGLHDTDAVQATSARLGWLARQADARAGLDQRHRAATDQIRTPR
jgi:hypothetical protein